jgi:alanyl-tRNA synthetase
VVGGRRVQVARVAGADGKALKGAWEALRKAGVEVAFLAGESDGKVPVLAASALPAVDARTLLQTSREVLGGGGGGKPDLAQGQGERRERLDEALDAVRRRLRELLGGT